MEEYWKFQGGQGSGNWNFERSGHGGEGGGGDPKQKPLEEVLILIFLQQQNAIFNQYWLINRKKYLKTCGILTFYSYGTVLYS